MTTSDRYFQGLQKKKEEENKHLSEMKENVLNSRILVLEIKIKQLEQKIEILSRDIPYEIYVK